METTLDRISSTQGKLKVTLIEADYKPEVDKKIKQYSKTAQIKGFRPGMVPKEYIQIAFDFQNQDQFELLVAQLADLGFDGFNEEEAASGINNGVGMSSVLGTSAGLGSGAGHCKTYILSSEFIENNIFMMI